MQRLKMVVPKGRIFQKLATLLNDASIGCEVDDRQYIPRIDDPEIYAKIMKPQNIAQVIELGSHDVGFTGSDWIVETGAEVVEILDLGLDPVRIVAAVPEDFKDKDLRSRHIVVASEYEHIAKRFLVEEGYDFLLIRTYGASEAFPPQDADMIIDNTATGRTLKEHNLRIAATLMESSTRFIANPRALKVPFKKRKIQELKMLFESVLNARERVMLEMNVDPAKLEEVVRILPAMRSPTVSTLYGEKGYAVKVAVRRREIAKLIPRLKRMGATDILEYEFRKVIA